MKEAEPIRAEDLMRRQVVTLSVDDSIESALSVFQEARISGAPVVEGGRLVGMLTLADVSKTEHLREGRISAERDYELAEPVSEAWSDELDPDEIFYLKEDYSTELLGPERVGDWMTRGVVSVGPEAPLPDVCRLMVERQIHRVCVTEGDELLGLITSFDVVRHVAGSRKRSARQQRVRK